jgi:predicted RNA binding protein YcfA (HicA-like mRNA interferase family)
MSVRADILKLAEQHGWSVEGTKNGHLRLRHEQASGVVIVSSTPSDPRALANLRSDLRRALPQPKRPPRDRYRDLVAAWDKAPDAARERFAQTVADWAAGRGAR